MTPTVAPDNATDKTVTWTSSDPNVATVDANGVVTAVSAGTATITATATNGTTETTDDQIATCAVTVTAGAATPTPTLLTTITPDASGNPTYSVAGIATLATNGCPYDATNGWYEENDEYTLQVTPAEGMTITSVKFITSGDESWEDTEAPFKALVGYECAVDMANDAWYIGGLKTIEVYGYATPPTATQYDITLADGSSDHGTVAFAVGGTAASKAAAGDVVTVSVTPAEGYSTKDVTVRAYTTWEGAGTRSYAPSPELVGNIPVTQNEGAWQFTMPESNVWVEVSYAKDVQDAWIQAIAEQTYTGEELTPAIAVMDGQTTLTLGTDYSVTYQNNVNVGTATVTVTGMGTYGGTANAQFTIVANKSELSTAIADAKDYYESIKDDYPTEASALNDKITDAEAMMDDPSATHEQVNDALAALTTSKTSTEQTIEAQELAGAKNDLEYLLDEAKDYYNQIKDSKPELADQLQQAITVAETAFNDPTSTSQVVRDATDALDDVYTDVYDEVQLDRIIVTIPAKSFMTRIDDKRRQIETPVSGVGLYTVQHVTDTQVELSSALTVVPAEMPYLLYNDNDEEVSVSIVVSEDDADNVSYDSDHFKGTLVDKTFTDEDMEEFDHYVLTNGTAFVWVKDAGTIPAGKCWIDLPASASNARVFSIFFDDITTGIGSISGATQFDNCYDLSGRRVTNPTNGVFIINGKKVLMK